MNGTAGRRQGDVAVGEIVAELAHPHDVEGARVTGKALAARWMWATTVSWYIVGLALLTSPLGGHPAFPYNWESYTAWHVFNSWMDGVSASDVLALTDGLMTDSGRGPLIGVPAWIGFQLAGVGLTSLRVPVMLVAALAVPLTWIVGQRLVGAPAAVLATALFALSPVWLLYGRTATVVGVSLVPALLTVYALWRALEVDGGLRWLAWLVALQALLVSGAYGYAPIRFLWPLGLGLIGIEAVRGPRRRWPLMALAITALALPGTLVGIAQTTTPDAPVLATVTGYYNARGEQLLALNRDSGNYSYYLRPTAAEAAGDGVRGTPGELARRLIRQNAGDLVRLLLDQDTAPALTHYYNPKGQPLGRLYPGLLTPFLGLGTMVSGCRALFRGRREDIMLLAMAGGFTLPMLMTSRVHIGRLIFAVPFLFLLVAVGAVASVNVLRRIADGVSPPAKRGSLLFAMLLGVVGLVLVTAMIESLWEEERMTVSPARNERVVQALQVLAPTAALTSGVALVTGDATQAETESITVASYRLMLDRTYQFVDLMATDATESSADRDGTITLYYGGLLDRLRPSGGPHLCSNVYLVSRAAKGEFLSTLRALPAACRDSIRYSLLPD